jgi:hypothetical protein
LDTRRQMRVYAAFVITEYHSGSGGRGISSTCSMRRASLRSVASRPGKADASVLSDF